MRLTPAERLDPTWKKLAAHLRERLESLRAQNENPSLDLAQTASLRGRIAEVKALLELDKEPPTVPTAPP